MSVKDASNYLYVKIILNDMYQAICSVLPVSSYAFKGGYVLKSILDTNPSTKDLRRTTDLDMDISKEEYYDMIINALIPVGDKWIARGVVSSYKYTKPTERTSGYFKLYKKPSENVRSFVFCGIDIGLHPLFYGIIQLNNGVNVYSLERMVSDKLWVMFIGTKKQILHRSKDILDIYLVLRYLTEQHKSLNKQELLKNINMRIKTNGVSLSNKSNLETLFLSDPKAVYNSMHSLISSVRVAVEFKNDLDINSIIKTTIVFINSVRGLL